MKGIEVKQVTKSFDKKMILNGIGMTIEPNKIYGLLGRNGAGKSTLLSLLVNRIAPDTGEIRLMSEVDLYPKNLKVKDVFKWTKSFYGGFDEELAQDLCEKFGLQTNIIFNKLSTGYRTIMKLIVALAVPVEYVFLDEPILGLDAGHREIFYNALVETYAENPRTFVISTHLIEEIANLIEHVLVIDHGRLIVDDETEKVLGEAYVVSGPEDKVDEYTQGLNVIGSDKLARIKASYVFGSLDNKPISDLINIDQMDLQTLFVNLTNGGNENE